MHSVRGTGYGVISAPLSPLLGTWRMEKLNGDRLPTLANWTLNLGAWPWNRSDNTATEEKALGREVGHPRPKPQTQTGPALFNMQFAAVLGR